MSITWSDVDIFVSINDYYLANDMTSGSDGDMRRTMGCNGVAVVRFLVKICQIAADTTLSMVECLDDMYT